MKEQIKELRVRIDGLFQLTKELKSFEWITFKKEKPNNPTINSPLQRVEKAFSHSLIGYNNCFESLIKTDKGAFRCSYNEIEDLIHYDVEQKSKEIQKVYDNLILAKAWLGKMLGELGTENPYGSGYKSKEDIVPTQDVSEVLCTTGLEGIATNKTWKELNHIEKVDWLRTEIEKVVNEIKSIARTDSQSFTKEFNISRTNCYNHLCEARFWLGFELERIRKN